MSAGIVAASYVAGAAGSTVPVTIPAGTVGSTLTDFVTRVDLADMPVEWWDATTSDLGNVRVKQDGTTIPFDIVTYDRTAQTGELYFKATLTTGDNAFTITASEGAVAIPADEPNGRDAVWADYEVAAIPGAGLINRRGGAALTSTGTFPLMGATYCTPAISGHDGVTFDGTHWYINTDTAIRKYDTSWNLVASNLAPDSDTGHTLTTLSDICLVGGELFGFMANGTPTILAVVWDPSDLSYKRHYDVTSSGWSPAGVCWNSDDSHFYTVGYSYGANVDTRIQKWDTSFNLVGTLTTTSIAQKQGIEYAGGYFWITTNSGDNLWRLDDDGTNATYAAELVGVPQGLFHDGEFLWVMQSSGASTAYLHKIEPHNVEGYHFANAAYLRATSLTKFTDWTIGCTAYMAKEATASRAFVSYSSNDTSDANRETLFAGFTAGRYILNNSTDSNLSDTTVGAPAQGDRYRWNGTHQGTTERKIWRNGVARATDTTVATRPGGTTGTLALFMGAEDTSAAATHYGSLTRIYLRNGVLSADWLAAEYESWETPSSFYTVDV